jgi:hypothetical protein
MIISFSSLDVLKASVREQETRGLTKPGVPRDQVQRSRRENKGHMQPPKTAPLSPL